MAAVRTRVQECQIRQPLPLRKIPYVYCTQTHPPSKVLHDLDPEKELIELHITLIAHANMLCMKYLAPHKFYVGYGLKNSFDV